MALRVWLPLNGNLQQQGASNVIATASTATVNTSGKIGSCYAFDNNSSYIQLEGNDLYSIIKGGSQPFSCCFWVYHADATRAIIFGDYSLSGAINFNIELGTNHSVRFYWNGSPDKTFNSQSYVTASGWTHITITYNGNMLTIYKDGVASTDVWSGTLAVKNKTSGVYYLGRDSRTGNTTLNGRLNDFRLYDHCLSAAEVREIAQGLVLHYKLNETDIENTVNYAPTPYKDSYSNISPGWDVSKHPNAIQPQNWTSGYNSGVSEPATGYHAMWNIIDGIPTIVFQNHNSVIGKTGRWLGVSSPTISISISANTKYTLSYEQRTIDTLGGYTTSGIYYKYNSSSGTNFHDGCPKIGQNTALNTWERFSYTFTRNASVDGTGTNGTIYIYGHYGTESTMQVRNIQLEIKDHATAYTQSSRTNTIVQDSSGHGNNGTINGTLICSNDSPRYSSCAVFNGTNTRINVPNLTPAELTISFWMKRGANTGTRQFMYTAWNGITCELQTNGTPTFAVNRSNYPTITGTAITTDSGWVHYCATFDTINGSKLYQNGVLKSTNNNVTPIVYNITTNYIGYYSTYYNGKMSDFRIYCTALSADDVLQLYHTGAKIDNKANIHTFELNENDQNKLTRTGILQCSAFSEFNGMSFLKYDPNIYIEPDGSCWVRVFHHNNPGAGSFSSSNDFAHSVYIDTNRWFNVELANYLNKWEIMVKGKFTSTSEEWKLRWIQQYNPMTATYDNVAVANITKITNGYSSSPASWGGLYFKNGSTYLCANNGTNGNWWGAVGSYSVYQSGIPGWGPSGTVTTTGFNDVYLRIDNVTFIPATAKNTKNKIWTGAQIIEL